MNSVQNVTRLFETGTNDVTCITNFFLIGKTLDKIFLRLGN
jgi:hypothetical protein